MLEIVLTMIAVVALGILALVATSVFMAYVTQAQYIDDYEFGDNNDD